MRQARIIFNFFNGKAHFSGGQNGFFRDVLGNFADFVRRKRIGFLFSGGQNKTALKARPPKRAALRLPKY